MAPKKEVTVVPNEPKGLLESWFSKITPPEGGLGYVSDVHLYNIHARSNRNWWYDKRGNRWPLRDSI